MTWDDGGGWGNDDGNQGSKQPNRRDQDQPRKRFNDNAQGPSKSGWGASESEGGGWGNDGGGWGNDGGNRGPKQPNRQDQDQPRKRFNDNAQGPSKSGWGASESEGGGWGNDGGGWGNDGGNRGPKQPNRQDQDQPRKRFNDNAQGPSKSGWGASESEGGGWGNDGGGWGNDGGNREPKQSNRRDENPDQDQPRKRLKDDNSAWGAPKDEGGNRGFKTTNREDNPQEPKEERPAPYRPEELNLAEEAEMQGDGAGDNFARYNDQKVTCLPKELITPVDKFEDIVTSKLLLENVKSQKYTGMTPIQKWAMPAIIEKHDLIACAQTGSGKTAAFLLPVLQTLLNTDLESSDPNSDCQNPYCLIISPTRELANQIYVHANILSKDSVIKCHVIYGQISTAHLKAKLCTGCHILVATPGKLKDFLERGWIGFKNIKYVILDEGDRLVDEGFTTDIRNFFNHGSMPSKEERQTLFFSATFKEGTQLSAREYLKDNFIFLTVGKVGAANEDIKQEFLRVERAEKKRELKRILQEVPETDKTIVFTQTKMAADMLASFFSALQLSSTSIHGDRHQSQREQAIRAFKKGEKRFLISSPVGNRGLDLPKVALVINYDMPKSIDEYVHRIGRTGRAGHTGRAISFFDETRDSELLPELIEILTEAKQEIPDWMSGAPAPAITNDAPIASSGNDDWGASSGEPNASTSAPQPVQPTPTPAQAEEDEEW